MANLQSLAASHPSPTGRGPKPRSRELAMVEVSDISETEDPQDWQVSDESYALGLSEDEETDTEHPTTSGLFPPGLFKSVLYKAHAATGLGPSPAQDSAQAQSQGDPLFSVVTREMDFVPTPPLFLETVRSQWSSPASGPAPSSLYCKFFHVASELAGLLAVPSIDPPVLALHAPTTMPGESDELLKLEDRKTEQVLLRPIRQWLGP